jgi:hypothetical protein
LTQANEGLAAMKKPNTAKKTTIENKKTEKEKKKGKAKKAPRGCCTLTGSGPAEQYEGVTKEECRLLAIQKGKNDHWWPGKCAKPN